MRHASGQFYGVSAPVAKYIARSASVLYKYANEDITVGSWMVGLDVEYVDERRMCCASPDECATRVRARLQWKILEIFDLFMPGCMCGAGLKARRREGQRPPGVLIWA